MTVQEAMTYCFNDEPHEGVKRKWFSNKEAADTYSESLKDLWSEGLGLVYGPFSGKMRVPETWYEVSYKETVYEGPKQYTKEEVEQQAERFEQFIASANLAKIGMRYLWFVGNDNKDGRYTPYVYIHRVLRLCKVQGAMYHPHCKSQFYSDILVRKSIEAFIAKH